jgi:hypothetical protein
MFIVGKRETQQYLMNTGLSSMNIKSILLENVVSIYGGSSFDYDAYWIENNSSDATRILNHDDFTVQWEQNTYYDGLEAWEVSGVWVTSNNPYPIGIGSGTPDYIYDIAGLDFSVEDNKDHLYFYTDKNIIKSDNIDETIVNLEIWNPDKSVKLDYSGILYIPIMTSTSSATMSFDVIAGKASKKIKTDEYGYIHIPNISRIGNFNVISSGMVNITSLYI